MAMLCSGADSVIYPLIAESTEMAKLKGLSVFSFCVCLFVCRFVSVIYSASQNIFCLSLFCWYIVLLVYFGWGVGCLVLFLPCLMDL